VASVVSRPALLVALPWWKTYAPAISHLLAVGLLLAASAPILWFNAWTKAMPLEFAGLYTLAAETLVHNAYRLPDHLPFYGPGGTPFVYPPVGFYVMAFATDLFNIPTLTYLRVVPAVLVSGIGIVAYIFAYLLFRSRLAAFAAALIFVSTPELLQVELFAGGVIRALALLWLLAGLTTTYLTLITGRRCTVVLSGLLLGLAIMTHPSAVPFIAISLPALLLLQPSRGNTLRIGIIALLSLITAAPWWATILERHGVDAFTSASGVMPIVAAAHSPGPTAGIHSLVTAIAVRMSVTPSIWLPIAQCLAYIGAAYCLAVGRPVLPLWFLCCLATLPLGIPYYYLPGSLMAATMLMVMCDHASRFRRQTAALHYSTLIVLLGFTLGYLWWRGFAWVRQQVPALSEDDLAIGRWIQANTSENATFLALSATGREADLEWFPYLLRRTPVFGKWGAEWTGRLAEEERLQAASIECTTTLTRGCISRFLADNQLTPDYIILKGAQQLHPLQQELEQLQQMTVVFTTHEDAVLQRPRP